MKDVGPVCGAVGPERDVVGRAHTFGFTPQLEDLPAVRIDRSDSRRHHTRQVEAAVGAEVDPVDAMKLTTSSEHRDPLGRRRVRFEVAAILALATTDQ